ncbi:Methyltransferase-like protein 4 [Halocaridina rubra]|uniref:Methyltransferase-like protein 4 n=1 Tax=Halocaridina rubra TaxID=373956 RepID=A0AAN8X7E0_HALRR
MSVIFSTENAIILDHEAWISKTYKDYLTSQVKDSKTISHGRNFEHLFNLRSPFMMDGHAEKIAKRMTENLNCSLPPKKKRRKKGTSNMQNARECTELFHVMEVFAILRDTFAFKTHFNHIASPEDYRNNNRLIRDVRKRFTEISLDNLQVSVNGSTKDKCEFVSLNGRTYILPPDSDYICDDVADILTHTSGRKYDVILMDPPWQNKYVHRRNKNHGKHHGYETMNVSDILKIPVPELLSYDGLLVVWCTNNENHLRELMEGLRNWHVHVIATWYWIKVTKAGEPVTSLSSASYGKRSYERILLARRDGQRNHNVIIPDGLLLCSIPSGIHSHKPPLADVLQAFQVPQSSCLELFARSLVPGWTCYGLEVLKLQDSFLFSA